MFPEGVTNAITAEITNSKATSFREKINKKLKVRGLQLFKKKAVRSMASKALDLQLSEKDPLGGLINKSIKSVLSSVVESVSSPDFINMQVVSALSAYMASEASTEVTDYDHLIPAKDRVAAGNLIKTFIQVGFPNTGAGAAQIIQYFTKASYYLVGAMRQGTTINPGSMVYLLQSLRGTLYDCDSYDEIPGGELRGLADQSAMRTEASHEVNEVVGSFFHMAPPPPESQSTLAWLLGIVARGGAIAALQLARTTKVKSFAQAGGKEILGSFQDHHTNRFLAMNVLEHVMKGMDFYECDPELQRPYDPPATDSAPVVTEVAD